MNGIPTRTASTNEVLRSKNKRRDEAIRKKVEQELTRRTNKKRGSGASMSSRRNSKGTVSSLRPNPAIVIYQTAKIIQAAQLMAAKRTDAVLAVNENGDLVGILTDKDIAFRVVAEGLDVRMTSVQDVMTKDPIAVFDKGNRNEALNIMISRRFRHLPVITDGEDEIEEQPAGTSVVGLLDITKCVFERLDDLERKVLEDQSIISAMEVLERRGTVNSDRVDHLRIEHECPDIASVLKKGEHPGDFPSISVKGSVRDAAKTMKLYHSTAVLVLGTPDGEDKVGGIFTTKDIVLRVIAASLDPNTTSVIRTMTPHPDFVSSNASILDALKKLHGI
jgi:CBS domain-containing protein